MQVMPVYLDEPEPMAQTILDEINPIVSGCMVLTDPIKIKIIVISDKKVNDYNVIYHKFLRF